jgi:hypothetical protein
MAAHPLTGDALPDESCYQSAKVLRALLVGIDGLEQATKRKDRVLPAGAGKPWDAEEDQSLVANFESGTSIADLAKTHQRTEGAIRSHLMKLGKCFRDKVSVKYRSTNRHRRRLIGPRLGLFIQSVDDDACDAGEWRRSA